VVAVDEDAERCQRGPGQLHAVHAAAGLVVVLGRTSMKRTPRARSARTVCTMSSVWSACAARRVIVEVEVLSIWLLRRPSAGSLIGSTTLSWFHTTVDIRRGVLGGDLVLEKCASWSTRGPARSSRPTRRGGRAPRWRRRVEPRDADLGPTGRALPQARTGGKRARVVGAVEEGVHGLAVGADAAW